MEPVPLKSGKLATICADVRIFFLQCGRVRANMTSCTKPEVHHGHPYTATPPDDWATVTGNVRWKFGEIWTAVNRYNQAYVNVYRQTDRHAYHNIPLPTMGPSKNTHVRYTQSVYAVFPCIMRVVSLTDTRNCSHVFTVSCRFKRIQKLSTKQGNGWPHTPSLDPLYEELVQSWRLWTGRDQYHAAGVLERTRHCI